MPAHPTRRLSLSLCLSLPPLSLSLCLQCQRAGLRRGLGITLVMRIEEWEFIASANLKGRSKILVA